MVHAEKRRLCYLTLVSLLICSFQLIRAFLCRLAEKIITTS